MLSCIITAVFVLLISTSFSISNSSIVSPLEASAQKSDRDSVVGDQDRIGDRINQTLQIQNKLREVRGEQIPNYYIVVLKDSIVPSSSVRTLAEEARTQGAELRHVYQNAIRGYAVRVPNQDVLDSILSDPAVDYVQPDVKLKAFAQELPTGIDRVDGDLSSTRSNDGSGAVDNIDIAILDTGIDLNHPDLNVFQNKTFVSNTLTADDDNGHGTRVAGIAAAIDDGKGVVGIAPGARLWAIKVLDSTAHGLYSDLVKGVDYVTSIPEIDTVNLSLGGEGPDDPLHTAIINSAAHGITYVAAAMNDNVDVDDANIIPASYPEVITVSAIVDTDGKCGGLGPSVTFNNEINMDDTLTSFSNFGSAVDLAAPGVSVKTTNSLGGYTSYPHFSGTSASAPHVTGAAALYKSTHPLATPSEIRDALRNSGSTDSTVCDGKGHGYFTGDKDSSPEPLLYMASGSPPPSDTTPPTVTSRTPASDAIGVAVGSSIVATFSEAVQSATGTTFTLKNSAGTSIAGTVTYDSATKTATLVPAAALAYSTSYTATLSNGIKDIAGNALAATSWSFTTAAAPPPPPSSCNNNLAINTATSTPTQSGYPANNAIDNTASTRWWSTYSANPSITVDLGTSKTICSVVISWFDGNVRTYTFRVEVSTGSSFIPVLTTTSKGTTSPETYSFADSSARFVKIVITQNIARSSNSMGQISELDVLGKTTTSGISPSSPDRDSPTNIASRQVNSNETNDSSSAVSEKSAQAKEVNSAREKIENNLGPIAIDDRAVTESNTPVVAKVLLNDKDPDGDNLKITSVSDSKHGAIVTINKNGTITFLPASNFAGRDTFTYTIADGKGKLDKAKVSINVMLDREQIRQIDKQVIVEQNQLTTDKQEYSTDERAHGLSNQGATGKNMKVPDTPTAYQSESTLSTDAEASK